MCLQKLFELLAELKKKKGNLFNLKTAAGDGIDIRTREGGDEFRHIPFNKQRGLIMPLQKGLCGK